jgi:ABC-2 type transport system permease protein
MIIVVPVVQLLILPLAANYEVKHISLAILDGDHSPYAQQMISGITATDYFVLGGHAASWREAMELVEQDKVDIILEIPAGFERDIVRDGSAELFIAANAINGVKAALGSNYLTRIIMDYNRDIRLRWLPAAHFNAPPQVEIVTAPWFNPYMNYRLFMVPGILAVLVTMIGGYMSALNIVKEKEIGTIEQINVSPIRKHHFILGKLIPFWILGMFVFTVGIIGVGGLVYGIWPRGSLAVLYAFLAVYLTVVLGFGLLVSTWCDTQQQAMSVAFFFIMIFLLMSGLFTPIDSMPGWAKIIARCNPVTYFVQVMRMIVLKGSGFRDIAGYLGIILLMGIGLNGWAILNYRKTG